MSNEFDLFQQEVAGIKPLKQDAVSTSASSLNEAAKQARQQAAQQAAATSQDYLSLENVVLLHPDDVVDFKKSGLQYGVHKKLRLGKYEIQAKLDLHKFRLEQARNEIVSFIQQCQQLNIRSALIITGKGHNSQPPALLKSYVSQWLPQIDAVLAIHSAQAMHGGTGAIYVLLKKSEQQKLDNRERHARRLAQ
ncbi:DNA endonuclease SmrA [Agarivorans sp. MS3-6]|uniref:DNA endonuclease SmrA n=1 Tax=Agarivorans sp. TSD2052 TaxID=2937286 RepID=UPI00200E9DA3|nr:DNA endonuclease SmrA [Agarivorans sp. TSD2052]UPW17346.1 DNA endonuclease SmrA [Agarivorans sp. TSD2052]